MSAWSARRTDESKTTALDFAATIDRSRLVHSAAFRRLQGKTQVMGVGENDFFRTRLTHSLEVAQIGIRINQRMAWLGQNVAEFNYINQLLAPDALIETACLAHDIGHPAFGHNGEKILNYYMHDHGGFEGNGQTLRILTRLGEYSEHFGYDLSRRTLLTVLKYPVCFADVAPDYPPRQQLVPRNISTWSPPKCIHDDERDALDWILAPFSAQDRALFCQVDSATGKSKFKSFDCSIMEWADDIAYGIHDLEDALAMGLLHPAQVVADLEPELKALGERKRGDSKYYIDKLLANQPRLLKQAISNMVKFMVDNTLPAQRECFSDPLLANTVEMRDEAKQILKSLKSYVFKQVILQPRLKTIEYKGQKIISELFEAFLSDPEGLMPKTFSEQINADNKYRIICDYIASMTDSEAASMYERLYLPGTGSVFEPI